MRKLLANILIASLTILSFGNLPPVAEASAFVDVNPGDRYYVGISYLKENSIIHGYGDSSFRSDQKITKAETLVMAMQANNIISEANLPEVKEAPFPDVPIASWYSPYIQVAKEMNLITGNAEGNFEPNKNVELVEALRIILEADNPGQTYEVRTYDLHNVPEDAWYAGYTSFSAWRTFINIYPSDTVNPHQIMDRAYTAEIIYRVIREKEGFQFGKATFYGKAVQGNRTASGEIFDYNLMTAAHKGLPFGTIVRVTNTNTGASVDVKINDRGPYGPGRLIDLSSAAFSKIASLGTGVVQIQFQVISSP